MDNRRIYLGARLFVSLEEASMGVQLLQREVDAKGCVEVNIFLGVARPRAARLPLKGARVHAVDREAGLWRIAFHCREEDVTWL